MKILEFIRFIAENNAELLAIIEEIGSWRKSGGITQFNASLARKSYQLTQIEANLSLFCSTGRVKVLAILHCFSDKKLWIPNLAAAKQRLVRNQNLFQKWLQGSSYAHLSTKNAGSALLSTSS